MLFLFRFLLNGIIVLAGIFAWLDNHLLPSQKPRRTVGKRIVLFTFIEHGGMWSDFFIVSPTVATILYFYAEEWDLIPLLCTATIAIFITVVMLHVWKIKGKGISDSLVHSGRVTKAGWVHAIYMIVALTVYGMFFLFTKNVPDSLMLQIGFAVGVHVFISAVQPSIYTRGKIDLFAVFMIVLVWITLAYFIWRV